MQIHSSFELLEPPRNLKKKCFSYQLYQQFIFSGYVKVLAGSGFKGSKDGIGQTGKFYHPSGMTFDRVNRRLFVADQVLLFL